MKIIYIGNHPKNLWLPLCPIPNTFANHMLFDSVCLWGVGSWEKGGVEKGKKTM